MMTDGLEQKLPIDAIEEALDVEIEHPVVTPAAVRRVDIPKANGGTRPLGIPTLASLVHGIDRRFAGPEAIGVGVENAGSRIGSR
jgi:hypothetical protein